MSKAKFHIIAILMSLMWNFSYGQKFTNYSIKEGLPSNHVYRLTQDKQGFIWIITDKGIVRFNGKDVKTFTTRNGLPTNDIWGIGITADQKIWFFSKAMEVGYIDRDSVVSFPSEVKGEVLNPVVQYQTKERMGFASNFESYHLNNKRWQKVPPLLDGMVLNGATLHPKVAQILIKRAEDSVYFVDKTGRTIRQKHLKSNLLYSNLRGQLNDSLFFWTNNSGYLVCNLNTLEFYNRSFLSEINKESVNFPRFHEVNSEIQLTGSGFVAQLDSSFRVKKMYEVPEAINSHFSFVDRDETLWMATFSKGVYKFPRRKREIAYDLLDEKISELNNLEGAVVASVYDKGFYTYNASQKNFNPLVEENGYILSAAHFEALNSSFFLTGKKIIRKKEGAFKEFHTGDANFKVNTLARNLIYKESYLYGIYSGGINKIDPETLKVVENYPQVGCYSILDFKGNIYLGTPSGIKVLSDKSLQEVNFENLDFDKPILKLRKVNDNEFLITTDGFGAYTSDLIQIRQLPETNYLSVQDAYVDETDIWLATDSGVYHYEQLEDGYNLVKIIDETNGLPTRNINAVTGVEENIVIGTDNGLAVFPKDLPTQSRLLDLYFENVAYNTTQVATNSESVRYSRANSLRADIGFIDYSDSENTFQYSYRLDPIHENWNATTSSTINFTDLKPDTYTLRIKSGELEEQMKFEISPLWWQRTPVRTALLILLLGSFLYIGYRFSRYFQEQQTKKLKQDKRLAEIRLNALRAQMNPHFVFNSLAAIQYYINNNEMEKSESFLVKFSKLIRRYFELSKEQEISIDDEVSLLQNYLEIEKLRFKDKLNFNIQVDQSLDSKNFMIPSMLLQPIVENAVNHGIFNKEETGKIDIGFKKVDHDKIQVVIEDDGVGYRNTLKKTKRKAKSSNVLSDRLYFLNQSGRWEITMSRKESNPESVNPGNICAFDIISKP